MGTDLDTFKPIARRTLRTALVAVPFVANNRAAIHYGLRRLLRRPFEAEFRALRDLLRDGDLCLDIGANHGQSIDALRMLGRDLEIIAVEPHPDLSAGLVRRFQKDPQVTVLPVGTSDQAGTLILEVPYYNGVCFDGVSSVNGVDGIETWLSKALYRYDPSKLEIRETPIEVIRLDDLGLSRVRFMKLDIQGSEFAALRGAEALLKRDHPILMIESDHTATDLNEFLSDIGYVPHAWSGAKLVPGFGYMNTIFLP